ncbi:HGL296Cp [Eremothecium sinecaudum]|uniref:Small ribosomal subunit protein mS38 n=1 Tax=Eremothecium sinecaudum TaxID=45286 RepID=A0A0X8HV85_9SACH|nr:HGL296Cp [Eremothecium sinecaudum]AMD22044.1 HGL296Cp [Eremothecium sinecaudum]
MLFLARSFNRSVQPVFSKLCRNLSLHHHTPVSSFPMLLQTQGNLGLQVSKVEQKSTILAAIAELDIQKDGMMLDSVLRKRRTKMKKHKLRKRRKEQKAERRKLSQGR